jgi:hypothetical protein
MKFITDLYKVASELFWNNITTNAEKDWGKTKVQGDN